jgi:hypothetical protein
MKMLLILGAFGLSLNLGAQVVISEPLQVQPVILSQPATNGILVLPNPPVAAGVIGARPNVADIIGSPPPAVGNTFGGPIPIAPQLSGYLPRTDTNPAIGVAYPPGSPEFVMMMAGITPPSQNSNAAATTVAAAAQDSSIAAPLFLPRPVTYHLAAPGPGRHLILREAENDLVRDFPPGTILRGLNSAVAAPQAVASPGSGVPARTPVAVRLPTAAAEGPEVVQEFPPGTVILRGAQSAR